jgi:two-component system, OmpR family, phosphate regulon sensor histidine kinase PhoR
VARSHDYRPACLAVVTDSSADAGRVVRMIGCMKGAANPHVPVESAVDRVSAVARALTSTTGGVAELQREVVCTAASIAGEGAAAAIALREGERLGVRVVDPHRAMPDAFDGWETAPDVIAGQRLRRVLPGSGSLLVLPMSHLGELVGALAVASMSDAATVDAEIEGVLATLANNAAIAMENARLYEMERESVRRLRELDTMKTDFLATVQHELRTPLTAILGLSDLIEMCWGVWEDSPKLDALRDIQVAARNLDGIVETIIDFSIGDGEALALAVADVPLEDAARAAIAVVGERYRGGLPVPVEVEVSPGVLLRADPDRLGQVLRALIDNAVKFSDGHGRVLVRAAPDESGAVLVEVIDEGIGIPAEDVPRIFERFYQVDNTATRRFGGTGMGLALARRVVEAHGATIDVVTRLGLGTRMSLRWPERSGASTDAREEDPVPSPLPVQ